MTQLDPTRPNQIKIWMTLHEGIDWNCFFVQFQAWDRTEKQFWNCFEVHQESDQAQSDPDPIELKADPNQNRAGPKPDAN